MQIGQWSIPLAEQKAGMGVDWDCTLDELSNMVPPAYTQWIGERLVDHLAIESDAPLSVSGAAEQTE